MAAKLDFNRLRRLFYEKFTPEGKTLRWVSAPGRVNLIGEHTDYHDGFVLPAAIDRTVTAVGRVRENDTVRVYSKTFDEQITFRYRDEVRPDHGWARRLEGILRIVLEGVKKPVGMDVYMEADLPLGGGLSSSAAAQAAIGSLALHFNGVSMDNLDFARAIQLAEHRYAGLKCGIMDPLAVLEGRKDHALLIDCRSLSVRPVPLPPDWRIVVLDTGVKHELASSEYNKRQEECHAVLELVQKNRPDVEALRDVRPEDLDHVAEKADPVGLKRCRYVLAENNRVLEVLDPLMKKDAEQVRNLFLASHEGLDRDYEVSCEELNAFVRVAQNAPGFVAGRMTGGGFGGSTVNFVEKPQVGDFMRDVLDAYRREAKRSGSGMAVSACNGVEQGDVPKA